MQPLEFYEQSLKELCFLTWSGLKENMYITLHLIKMSNISYQFTIIANKSLWRWVVETKVYAGFFLNHFESLRKKSVIYDSFHIISGMKIKCLRLFCNPVAVQCIILVLFFLTLHYMEYEQLHLIQNATVMMGLKFIKLVIVFIVHCNTIPEILCVCTYVYEHNTIHNFEFTINNEIQSMSCLHVIISYFDHFTFFYLSLNYKI